MSSVDGVARPSVPAGCALIWSSGEGGTLTPAKADVTAHPALLERPESESIGTLGAQGNASKIHGLDDEHVAAEALQFRLGVPAPVGGHEDDGGGDGRTSAGVRR